MTNRPEQPEPFVLLSRAEKIMQECRSDLFDVEENVHLLKAVLSTLSKHPARSDERKGYSTIVPALVTSIVTRLYAICFDATGWKEPDRISLIMSSQKSCFTDAVYLIKGGDPLRNSVRDLILRRRSFLDARWEGWQPIYLIRDSDGKITDELRPTAEEAEATLREKRSAMDEALASWVALSQHPAFDRFQQSRHHTFSHNIKKVDSQEAYGLTFPELTNLAESSTSAMAAICLSHFGFSSDLTNPRRGDRFLTITRSSCDSCQIKPDPKG
jgi:hypothetical protein